MVISQFSVSNGSGLWSGLDQTRADRLPADGTMTSELNQLEHLINQATVAGRLTRQDEESIWMALVQGSCFTVEKCSLFRQLQERVWQAELYLEP